MFERYLKYKESALVQLLYQIDFSVVIVLNRVI